MNAKSIVALGASLGACAVLAVEITGRVPKVDVTSSSAELTLNTSTFDPDAFPSDVPTPIFRFDANATDGWTVEDGTNVVAIPSLTLEGTDRRVLKTDVSGAENTWKGWSSTKPLAPVLTAADASSGLVAGRKYLDFGVRGSKRALVFDTKNYGAASGETARNLLANIGTVITVYGSQNGGGYLLGGGYRYYEKLEWMRDETSYLNPIFKKFVSNPGVYGIVRHDGRPTAPGDVGFSGGWEVLSFVATNACVDATGLGINDGRDNQAHSSGGMRIAEFMAFDQVLDATALAKIEAYLEYKWFGRQTPGWNNQAEVGWLHVNSGATDSGVSDALTATIPSGGQLRIDRLTGGRGKAATFTKSGEGTLSLGDTTEFGGTLVATGGKVTFPVRTVPAALGDLPTGAYLHFDASDADSVATVTEGGVEYLSRWDDLVGTQLDSANACLRTGTYRAWLHRDILGTGKHTIDLGDFAQYEKPYLFFSNASETKEKTLTGVTTLIAVMSPRSNGGNLIKSSYWDRATGIAINGRSWMGNVIASQRGNADPYLALNTSDGRCFINGLLRTPNSAFVSPGFQVVAIQMPGGSFSRLACHSQNYGLAGFQYAEMFFYKRELSEREILDVSAYLAKRWLDQDLPGYQSSDKAGRVAADLGGLTVDGTVEIEVPEGRTLKVGTLTVSGRLVKSGTGTLEAENIVEAAGTHLEAGSVFKTAATDVSALAEVAADPSLRVDASAALTLDTETVDDVTYVKRWRDVGNRQTLWANGSDGPTLKTDAGGRTLVDCGDYGSSGKYLGFERPLAAVKAAFVVAKVKSDKVWLVGNTKNLTVDTSCQSGVLDFWRGSDGKLFNDNGYNKSVSRGGIWLDGVAGNYNSVPSGDVQLYEVYPTGSAHASALARDTLHDNTGEAGGLEIAEVILYERTLSEREKVATRNYLLKKWLGKQDSELTPLPAASGTATRIRHLDVTEETSPAVLADDVSVDFLSGSGTAVKTGAGATSLGDFASFTGTVSVAAGTLRLTRGALTAEPALAESGRLLHLDMTTGVERKTSATADYVKSVASRAGNGWKIVAGGEYFSGATTSYPDYRTDFLNELPGYAINSLLAKVMLFEKDGMTNTLYGIRSAFWLAGTVEGRSGGFLLGGGRADDSTSRGYQWHRGGGGGDSASDSFVGGAAKQSVREADWYKDGVAVTGTATGFDENAWNCVSCVIKADGEAASADGLGFDGRFLETGEYNYRNGKQNIAEVILYDRSLSESERMGTEAYLMSKWGLKQASTDCSAALAVADGAVADLCGQYQKVAELSGAGVVSNGTLAAAALVADAAASAAVQVKGTFSIAAGQVVRFSNLQARSFEGVEEIEILSAEAFEGLENLKSAIFVGEDMPSGCRARLRVSEIACLPVCARAEPCSSYGKE